MECDIAKDRELCEKATPGPWSVMQRGCHALGYDVEGPESGVRGMFEREEDAEFCAKSRTALPYYISRCEHMERMLEAAIEHLDDGEVCGLQIGNVASPHINGGLVFEDKWYEEHGDKTWARLDNLPEPKEAPHHA